MNTTATNRTTAEVVADMIERGSYEAAANTALTEAGVTFKARLSNTKDAPWGNDEMRNHFRVTLRSRTGSTTFDFFGSIADAQAGKNEARPYDVLACLQWSDPGTFEDFCGNYGYDMDSRKAEKTYKACRAQFLSLGRVVINEEMRDAFAAIA